MTSLVSTNYFSSNVKTIDSREVSEMIQKKHGHLCRDIQNYIDVLSTNPKMDSLDYFIESTYTDKKNEVRKCYNITKIGCEMIANKLTGKKGILFTAEYVKRFNQMEQQKLQLTTADMILQSAILLKQMETKQQEQQEAIDRQQEILEKQQSELDTLNNVCTDGTKRQKLNNLVRNYANKNGVQYASAWEIFKEMFNNAYHTNLNLLITNYAKSNYLKKRPSAPEYFELTGTLDDALRVAEKM